MLIEAFHEMAKGWSDKKLKAHKKACHKKQSLCDKYIGKIQHKMELCVVEPCECEGILIRYKTILSQRRDVKMQISYVSRRLGSEGCVRLKPQKCLERVQDNLKQFYEKAEFLVI